MKTIRVLHCPDMVGGNAPGLARAERQLGIESWAISMQPSSFAYPVDELLCPQGCSPAILAMKRFQLLWRALRDFDIIHFNFGLSVMPPWLPRSTNTASKYRALLRQLYGYYARMLDLRDLPLLRIAGKGLVVTYQGDDARQADYCRKSFAISPADEVEPGYYSAASDARKRHRIATFGHYADRIYAVTPDLLHVLPVQSQLLPCAHVDLSEWQYINVQSAETKVPVVLHAPSHRGVKGTRFVLDAVRRLQAEGVPFEFALVEGLTHEKARAMYQRADLLVDQLLCGWYGGLAVELMALGKPVICYLREDDLKFVPQQMGEELPIIRATPTTCYDVLKEWLTRRKHELPDIGRRSRAYVEKWHNPVRIATMLKNDYEAICASKQVYSKRQAQPL